MEKSVKEWIRNAFWKVTFWKKIVFIAINNCNYQKFKLKIHGLLVQVPL